MAQIRVDWVPFEYGLNVIKHSLNASKDPQVQPWLKLAQPVHSMFFSMPSF
jgi:hypothetical protein